jgi:hypothetical protein
VRSTILPISRQAGKPYVRLDVPNGTLSMKGYCNLSLSSTVQYKKEGIELPFAPLRELDNIEIEYVYDFSAPVVVSGMNSLCYITYRSSESCKPGALPFLLERSKAYINNKSSDYTDNARTPIHYALKERDTRNLKLLLDVEGADMNSKDSRGLTPIEAACERGWNEPVWVLVHNTKVQVTMSAVRWAENNKMWPEIIKHLQTYTGLTFLMASRILTRPLIFAVFMACKNLNHLVATVSIYVVIQIR